MALLNIITDGNPLLRKKSREVKEITPRIREIIEDMKETMVYAEGVGLAAPQVGILKRMVVINIGNDDVWHVLVNPVITKRSGSQDGEEACLSVPGRRGIVNRPMNVTVEGIDENGAAVTLDAEGYLARAVCHECDHLDGGLFIDIMTEELFDDDDDDDYDEADELDGDDEL